MKSRIIRENAVFINQLDTSLYFSSLLLPLILNLPPKSPLCFDLLLSLGIRLGLTV